MDGRLQGLNALLELIQLLLQGGNIGPHRRGGGWAQSACENGNGQSGCRLGSEDGLLIAPLHPADSCTSLRLIGTEANRVQSKMPLWTERWRHREPERLR